MLRRGISSVEILIAAALLTAAFIPVYSLVQGNQKNAYMNELHVLARRRAKRVIAYLAGHPYWQIKARATGDAPPDFPGLPDEGTGIEVPILTGAREALLLDAPEGQLDGYVRRVDKMDVRTFFHELEPGLGRISVLVTWEDPTSGQGRFFVAVRFVEDAFHWRGR